MALHSEVSELTLTASQTVAAPLLAPASTGVSAQEGDDVVLTVPLAVHSGVPTHVTWTRGDVELVGERFSSVTQRGAVTLNVRNATVGDSGRYSLSARNDAGHAHSDLLLEVRTRPGDVPVFLRRLNDLAVKVGTRTRFLVEIRSPTQVKVSWEQEGKPVVESERFHLLHEGNFFCVDVAPVTLADAGLWICRAHNSNGSATCFCHLNVLVPKAYKAPHFIEELVAILTEQGTVSLECKVVGVPTPTLKWFKDNQEIKAGDVFALSANPQDTTSLGTYTCEAINCMGHALSTSRVHVLSKEGGVTPVDSLVPKGPAPVFSKELRNDKVKIGGKISLSCKVRVPPWPKSITWFNKAGLIESGGRYHVIEDGLGAYSVEVDPVEASDEGEWKCVATSNHGVKGISTCNVSVSYPKNYKKPKFLESLKAILTEEGLVSFECKVVGYPTPQLQWFKDGQELKPGDVYQLTGTNSLGSYCCIAKNCMGETSSTAELTVEDIQSQLNEEERLQLFSKNQPPRFLQGLKSLETKILDPLRFTVQVSVSPQPSVTWYRDDEEVQESERYKKEQETKGFCHLSIKRLELMDQAEWKCVATNDYGQSVTSCFLKLSVPRHYKKPRFLENLRAVLSEEGAVNLECKVIGVPQPTLKWYKDGRELKPGDIHRIISGQDGTCCLGTYTCEATNCMGTVASSASLLGFEDRAQVKPQPEPLRPLPPPAAHLVRHPSLSTILEERTSQLHDTVASDERAEVSFSFDGKEVSVSLYETPDLTEEEALQVVEMYAEELSEHISEHNIVELPPMRFVKETSQSGHLLMEAVVIDVSPEYYASAEDRTEADLDEFSITEDNGFMSPQVLTPDEMPFEKFTADFLESTVQLGQKAVPVKPPRKRGADNSESSYHSLKEAKLSPEEESSEFADALSSIKDKSQKDSFISAKGGAEGSGGKSAGKIEAELESRKPEDLKLEGNDDKLTDRKKPRKKSRSRSRSAEIKLVENVSDTATEKKVPKRPLKKRKSTDSEKEDDSLREFERQKSLKAERNQGIDLEKLPQKDRIKKSKSSESEKEDDSLQEFESRKSLKIAKDSEVKTVTKPKILQKKHLSDSSGREDDSLIEYEKKKIPNEGISEKSSSKSEKQDRQKSHLCKSISTDSSEKDEEFAIKSEQSEQLRKRKKRSIKKLGSTEKKTDTTETGVEIPPSSEAESCDRDSFKNKKVVSTSDLDRMRSNSDLDSIGDKSRAQEEEEHSVDFDTAEDSAYDKSEMSVLESLSHSIKEIKKGLAAVEERVISESTDEPQSAKSSLSAIESLVQPINEIQRGLIEVEKQAEETEAGQYSPSSILETLKEPIQELGRNLAEIEKAKTTESEEESLLKKTSHSLLETVSHPLQELQKELNFIHQQAIIETGEETYSDVLQSFKPSLLVVQGGVEQTEGDFTSKIEDLTDVTVLPQGTYAQQTEQTPRSIEELRDQEALDVKQNDLIVPLTVLDVEESLAETGVSLTTLGAFDLHSELEVFSGKLENCLRVLNKNAEDISDGEVKDILISLGKLVTPLIQFKNVIEKCLRLVSENDRSNDPQVRSSNMVLKATLESPVHALGKCLNLLETVANTKSSKQIRGLGIKILYKLSFPLEELKTTMKLIENLSEHTSIELLVTPVENLISASSVINLEASKSGFAENIPEEGLFIVRELDDAVGVLSRSVASMTKSLSSQSSLRTVSSLSKPLADFQMNLHKLENKIKTPEKYSKVTPSEIYNLAQDLCKPLQAIRTELSIAQHEIELDQYSHLSLLPDSNQDNTLEFATNIIHQSVDQVHKSVLTCTEFVLSKSPSETMYVRYLLFALNELILPLNQLNKSVIKAKESLSEEVQKMSEPNIGILAVTSSASELLSVLSELRHHSLISIGHPEIQMIQLLCTMEEPLLQVERGLRKIIEHTHEEDKNILNINMLKTLAEPFKCLQKSLINIYEKLGPESIFEGIFLELRHPIQELQRSILIIQDQVSFEYGDEPASIESNIFTLQSLVNPLNALKKQFMELDDVMIEKTQSTSYSKTNKNLHSIIKVSHELQLKLSSIMIEENYVNKHSLDSLDMFPIFQDLTSLLRDFENALRRVDLICQNETEPNINVHNKMCEAVKLFTLEVTNFQNKMMLASNKALKDVKHPVHFLKRGTETFVTKLAEIVIDLENWQLDEPPVGSYSLKFYQNLLHNFKEFSEFIIEMETTREELAKDSSEMTHFSSSDTIKDVNTIMEEVTQTRVSLESVNILSSKKTTLEKARKEVKTFCELLKSAEDSIIDNTFTKANSLTFNQKDERRTLNNAFSSMVEQLHKIESYIVGNQEALESVNCLKNTIEVIQEHLSFGEEISEVYILQNLSAPLKSFKDNISRALDTVSVKSEETLPVSSYLERFEKSASDLELGLMKLEHALLNSTGDFSSLKNIDIDVIAHPIKELVRYINCIEEQQTGHDSSETLVDQSSLSMLKTLAQPIREIQEGVLLIQEQIALETSGKTPSGKSCAGILYEIAKPIRELRSGVALIQEQIVMEPDVEPLSEETRASSLQTFAAPIEEMKKILSTITEQQPLLFEADVQSMSENISLLKTIAQPVKELQNKLASIEINQIMESGVESFSAKENILALAKSVLTLQEGIASVESQMTLETAGNDSFLQNSVSMLKEIANPLLEISKGIAVIFEQQFIEEGNLEDFSSVSEPSTLADVKDVSLADAAVIVGETVTLEHGLSFQGDMGFPQVAKTTIEDNLQSGVIEQQQFLLEMDTQVKNNYEDTVKYESLNQGRSTLVEQEIMPYVQVQEHETLSQANTLTLSEDKTLHVAEFAEESLNIGVQAEIQDAVVHLDSVSAEKPVKESAMVKDVSLNIAAQVDVQEALSNVKALTSNEDLPLTDIEPVTLTPCIVQGELQQSLADVESLETEEDTLESISIQDTSFRFEPHINDIQEALSNVGDLVITEKTLCEAEIKTGVREAVQNETLQTLDKEAHFKSLDVSSEEANISVNTPNIAAETEMQQMISNVDDMKTIKYPTDSANLGEVSLQCALQVECHQIVSDVESLKTELASEKYSQAMALEESHINIAEKMQVQELFSVAEQIDAVKNEESLNIGVQAEIQNAVDHLDRLSADKPVKESAMVKDVSLNIAAQVDVQEALSSVKAITSNEDLPLTDIEPVTLTPCIVQGELQQSLADVESLETEEDTLESISIQDTSFRFEPHINDIQEALSNVGDLVITEKTLCEAEIKTGVREAVQNETLQTLDKEAHFKSLDVSSEEANISVNTPNIAAETEMQQMISNVDDMKTIKYPNDSANLGEVSLQCALQVECHQIVSDVESLKTELASEKHSQAMALEESHINIAEKMQVQELFSVAEQIDAVKNEESLNIGVQAEIQDAVVHLDRFSADKPVKESAMAKDVSLNIAARVDVQEALSSVKALTSNEDLPLTDIEPVTLTPCIVQGELQQSLADVESLETEEDTLESISIQDTSFRFEPHINDIQEALSNVGDLVITEKTLCEAEIKTGVREAVQNETLQTLDKEAHFKSLDVSSEEANISVNTPNIAAETEMQQMISNVDDMKTIKYPNDSANLGEVSLQCALQVECHQIVSDVESLKTELASEKHSQAMALEESHINIAEKMQVQELFSVAEQIDAVKNEESLNIGVQAEIQDAVVHLDRFSADKPVKESAMAKDVSLNIAARVDVQEALSSVKALTSNEDLPLTDIEPVTLTPCIVQGELQQSLADVESLETEEDTLESISIQDTSFRFEPHINDIQEALSNVGDLVITEKTLCEAEIKTGVREAVKNETLQTLDKEAHFKSLDVSSEEANISVNTPNIAAETQMQQMISNVDDMKTIKYPTDSANLGEVSLQCALQVECNQILSDVESLKTELASEKYSQAMALEESHINVAVKTQVQEFLSVVEQIEAVKNELQVKVTHEPLINETARQEVQQVLQIAEDIISLKEEIQANMIENPNVNELPNIKQVLSTCEEVKHFKDTVQEMSQEHPEIDKDIENILSLAKSLEKAKESPLMNVSKESDKKMNIEKSLVEVVNIEEPIIATPKTISETQPVAVFPVQSDSKYQKEQLSSSEMTSQDKEMSGKESSCKQAIETQLQQFIMSVVDISYSVNALEAKVINNPAINYAVQQEFQEIISTVGDIKTVTNILQAPTKQEESIKLSSQVEIQQVLLACNSLEKLKETVQAKMSKEFKVYSAIESELQQILSIADTFQIIKQSLTANITELEALYGTTSFQIHNVLSSNRTETEKEFRSDDEVQEASNNQYIGKNEDTSAKSTSESTKSEGKEGKYSEEKIQVSSELEISETLETTKLLEKNEIGKVHKNSNENKLDIEVRRSKKSELKNEDVRDIKISYEGEEVSDVSNKVQIKPVEEKVETINIGENKVSIESGNVKTELEVSEGKDYQEIKICPGVIGEVEIKSQSGVNDKEASKVNDETNKTIKLKITDEKTKTDLKVADTKDAEVSVKKTLNATKENVVIESESKNINCLETLKENVQHDIKTVKIEDGGKMFLTPDVTKVTDNKSNEEEEKSKQNKKSKQTSQVDELKQTAADKDCVEKEIENKSKLTKGMEARESNKEANIKHEKSGTKTTEIIEVKTTKDTDVSEQKKEAIIEYETAAKIEVKKESNCSEVNLKQGDSATVVNVVQNTESGKAIIDKPNYENKLIKPESETTKSTESMVVQKGNKIKAETKPTVETGDMEVKPNNDCKEKLEIKPALEESTTDREQKAIENKDPMEKALQEEEHVSIETKYSIKPLLDDSCVSKNEEIRSEPFTTKKNVSEKDESSKPKEIKKKKQKGEIKEKRDQISGDQIEDVKMVEEKLKDEKLKVVKEKETAEPQLKETTKSTEKMDSNQGDGVKAETKQAKEIVSVEVKQKNKCEERLEIIPGSEESTTDTETKTLEYKGKLEKVIPQEEEKAPIETTSSVKPLLDDISKDQEKISPESSVTKKNASLKHKEIKQKKTENEIKAIEDKESKISCDTADVSTAKENFKDEKISDIKEKETPETQKHEMKEVQEQKTFKKESTKMKDKLSLEKETMCSGEDVAETSKEGKIIQENIYLEELKKIETEEKKGKDYSSMKAELKVKKEEDKKVEIMVTENADVQKITVGKEISDQGEVMTASQTAKEKQAVIVKEGNYKENNEEDETKKHSEIAGEAENKIKVEIKRANVKKTEESKEGLENNVEKSVISTIEENKIKKKDEVKKVKGEKVNSRKEAVQNNSKVADKEENITVKDKEEHIINSEEKVGTKEIRQTTEDSDTKMKDDINVSNFKKDEESNKRLNKTDNENVTSITEINKVGGKEKDRPASHEKSEEKLIKVKQEAETVVTKKPSTTMDKDIIGIEKVAEEGKEGREGTKLKSIMAKETISKKEEKKDNQDKDKVSPESDNKKIKDNVDSNKKEQKKSESKVIKKSELKKGKKEVGVKEGETSVKKIIDIKPDEKVSEISKIDTTENGGTIKIQNSGSGKETQIELNNIKIVESTSVNEIKSKNDALIEEVEKAHEINEGLELKKPQEHLRMVQIDAQEKELEFKNKDDTQDKSSLCKTTMSERQEADTKNRSSKKQKDKLGLDDSTKDVKRKQTTIDSEVKEKLLIIEKEENQHTIYVDESSTSDYGSESYSEPYQIKKSQSYDTRQWAFDSKSGVEEVIPRVASKDVRERKYEAIGLAEHEKVAYTSRQSTSKPVFCGRLVDRTASQGSKLKVTCSLTGTPDPTVQWFKDGQPVDTSLDHRIRTRLSNGLASLEIVEAKVGDSGKYTCTARNTHGEATTTANIKVFSYLESAPEAPVFTQNIRDHYKSASDELVIECRVKGHPQPSVVWTKDGQPLRPLARYEQSVLTDGTCCLVIHGPEANDSGLYKCVAENAVWSEQTSAHVMFEGREKYIAESRSLADPKLPRFTNIVSDTIVREGGTVALQVAVKGTPRAEVTWYRGSEPLPKRSSRFRYLEDAGVYSLVMTEASVREAGTYTCRASNAHGFRDTSVNVEIVGASGASAHARGKPAMFTSRPDTSMSIAVGEDVSFSFRVSGDPKPRVTWMKGMKDITNNIRALKETVNDYVRLTLKHATVMDAGTYFIMAKNIYGADHAFVTVRVKQRARSLTPTRMTIWSGPDTSTILRDIHETTRALVNDVPGPISSAPVVSDCGKNWLSLSWGKPDHRGAAPVLAYRVEAWLLGTEGGAQWNELGVTPINSFDVFFLKPGSEYKFRVTARNRYGWGESVTTTEPISVGSVANFPPDIVRDLPGPLKALQGDNVSLECEINGDPPPTIQWLKDGQNVGMLATLKDRVFVSDDQLIHRLIIKQLTEDDSGRYVCEAVNKLGRASTYARLLVVTDPRLLDADRKLKESLLDQQESAPQFTMRLRDRRVQESYPVRLSCQVIGSPTPSITWARQGQPIADDDRHQIMQEADHFHTLEICRTLLEDSGEYTATAHNCLGAVSCHCQLIVDKGIRAYISPEFTAELSPAVTVKEGAELRLFAQVEAYPTVSISWQRDGVRLRPSRRLVMTLDPEGRVELALAHLTVRDAGLYTCSATNAVGRAETVCQVFVSGGIPVATGVPTITTSNVPYSKEPRFVTKPRSSEAVEGDTVVINCEVVGDPQPEVMWLRDWLKPGYYRDAPQFRQAAGGTAYSLEIPQAKLDFTGTYCVIARNSHGEAKAIISLQIYAKGQGKESSMVSGHVKHGQVETLPEIKRELRDLRCCDGDAVTLECLVTATPLPSVRWEKDGKILPLGEDIEAELDGEIARLTIKKVYPEDEGQYSCVAYNDLGRAVTSACLVVDVPEEKETLLSQQLTRPPGLLSARSTPRSTPRNTPSPARSLSPTPARYREFSSPSFSRPKRVKMSSPKFYTVPHNRIAEEGETVRFQCSVAGHPTPWASWDKDGHIVTPSSRLSVTERDDLRTLELREVTVEDAGLYRVTLENEMGSVEATARLDIIGRQGSRTRSVRAWSGVRSSPTFGRRLVGSAARVGGTFTLTCDVHASPSPVTSWYRNGEMLVKSTRVVPSWDGRRARLELRSLEPEDAGVYTCVAENAVGTTQCSAELRILQTTDPSDADLQPPVFLQGLAPEQTAAEGQPFELQVRLQGSNPLEVVWVKDGVEVPDCPDLHHVDYGDGRFGLRIADVFVADGGIYNCEAFNDHGDAITSGHLIVNDMSGGEVGSTEPEIMFTKTPSPVLARMRGQASFCARLQSRPLSHTSFTWTVNGRSVNNDDRFTVTTEEDCSILHVAEVCPCDVGAVVCTAKVCSPSVPPTTVSCDTTLGLDPSPGAPAVLLRGPCDTTAMRGDRVLLKATYRGDPEPSVRWLKAGRELSSEDRVQIASRDGVSCLTISAIDADDSGKYVVSIENIHGADCHFASVAVEGPPEAPAARPSVTAAGEGCVTVAWSSPPYDGGCVITGYRVEMRTALSNQWSVVADRCHSLSHVVRGLTAGQTYLFRVRAENIHGASESSAESFPFMLQSPHAGLREEEGEGEGDVELDAVLEPRLVTLEPGDQFLERYSVHEELGKGRYGVVHKVTDLRTGHTMAAKFVRCIKKQDREKAQEEIDIMNCLRHPKLLQLAAAFDNPKDMVMVMEYISGGELFERVVADDFTLTERDCILFLRQICEGVRYMHTCNVVHLDLKPENIMCHTRTSHRVKIIDFGLAQKLQSNTPVRVLFGTPEFIPPEIINYEPIGVESDMWSVGVICYVLLSGLSPFMGDNDAETFANITRADFDFDDEAFEAISQDAKDFISSLLIKRKEKRLTAEECLKHKWLTQSDTTMSSVKLCTDKLKKFIIRRKWQKTGNAIRALGRMATLSAASRRNSSASSPPSPRPSLSASRMSSLGEEATGDRARGRVCSERSDSGISDCSSINTNATPTTPCHLLNKKYSICEEPEDDPSSCRLTEHGVSVNKLCGSVNGKATSDVSAAAKKRTTNSLRLDSEPAKAPSPTLQKDAKLFGKSENFQKAFAFWKQ